MANVRGFVGLMLVWLDQDFAADVGCASPAWLTTAMRLSLASTFAATSRFSRALM